jgi:hypothetical protein
VKLTNPRLRFIVPAESVPVFAKGGHSHLVDAEAMPQSGRVFSAYRRALL